MNVSACWFGLELDFRADLSGMSFYFGASTVDDDEPEPDPRGDVTCYPIGFAKTPHPGWESSLNTWDEPSDDQEDV